MPFFADIASRVGSIFRGREATVAPDTSGNVPMPALLPGEAPRPQQAQLAPYPVVDKYPTIIGSRITAEYVSSVLRICLTGYRREFVDLLDEMLEREPHGYAVLAQRILTVAGARLEVLSAELEDDDPRQDLADEIAGFVRKHLEALPDRRQSFAALLWALYYGVAAAETQWAKDGFGKWVPRRLHFIHSRRLSYPDPGSWGVRIWDQGGVSSWWTQTQDVTSQSFGISPDWYPGKFIVHAPQVRGDYPTREGLGRQVIWYFLFKAMAVRGAGQFVERYGKPWAIASYRTNPDRIAETEDIAAAESIVGALGLGSGGSAALPDCIKVELMGPSVSGGGKGIKHQELIDLCNAEISKAVLGQTLTTEAGKRGNVGATDVHKQGADQIAKHDAGCLEETLRRDLVMWMVRFNYGAENLDLCPDLRIHTEEKPDPMTIIARAAAGAAAGLPVDADKIAKDAGLPLVPQEDESDDEASDKPRPTGPKPRRMGPLKPMTIGELEGEEPAEPEPKPLPAMPTAPPAVSPPPGGALTPQAPQGAA